MYFTWRAFLLPRMLSAIASRTVHKQSQDSPVIVLPYIHEGKVPSQKEIEESFLATRYLFWLGSCFHGDCALEILGSRPREQLAY